MLADPVLFWRATIAAALLRQACWLTRLALGLVLLTLVATVLAGVIAGMIAALPGMLSLAAGCAALWLGLRIGFDADLFDALARTGDLAGFDRAMIDLGLLPPGRAGRPLEVRIKRALWLGKMQVAALVIQAAAFMSGVVLFARMGSP